MTITHAMEASLVLLGILIALPALAIALVLFAVAQAAGEGAERRAGRTRPSASARPR